ncbi:hypothetical protein BHU72_06760 [Desulfuribacillus stibiiarsenatis]|uniref:Flagellar biosynthesis protein FlaG n=1 Tax=Desulfuribacillus stibiiarsenatis TaxID=1390249 RepID=A0A1E5L4K2_9FIRM|nr:flagellar protein FlaG [Desulfuribacillus stibiiarsenatis]OEH84889.1 hypothetical protein BHU72_06760 [Desulfuribacillus stibiiarsenatis]
MNLQASNSIMRPMVKMPDKPFMEIKTPRQDQLEKQHNVSNESVKSVVRKSTEEVYNSMKKLVENTDYSVNYKIDEYSGMSQVSINMKNSGKEVASLPPDIATIIADRATKTTIGVMLDFYA